MSQNEISLKPISELLKENFFIPGYQRGYRWTKRQVIDLLNDIREFQRESESKKKETFYCLQPLVVRESGNEGEWELIDGQQRLTTIYLILSKLKDILGLLGKSPYSLHYETREDSWEFLQAIDLEKKNQNIDYFHICSAYEAIDEWFGEQDGTYKIKFLQTLLSDDETGKNVKVIWYEIREQIDPVEVFTRLNIGKIPLTNAELVKALFLRSRNFHKNEITLQQLKIAQEWDSIEKALQADDFWYFINNSNEYDNRIEYVLKLMADGFQNAKDAENDSYYTFIAFNRRVNETGFDSSSEWMHVKRYFMMLEEWYKDRHSFHLVGYLVNQGVSIPTIRMESSIHATKQEFKDSIKTLVFSNLFGKQYNLSEYNSEVVLGEFIEVNLNEWNYESDKSRIRSALLLFNIATLLRCDASNYRFQFDSYKKQDWDIEHIRSVSSRKPDRADLQKSWLNTVLDYMTGTADRSGQEAFLSLEEIQEHADIMRRSILLLDSEDFDRNMFDDIYDEYLTIFNERAERETDNGIGNLALLDAGTNRSYKNAVFPVKRKRILALDRSATFVPLCTKHVFLKYYNKKISQMMVWSEDDRDEYQQAIIETLTWFFSQYKGAES